MPRFWVVVALICSGLAVMAIAIAVFNKVTYKESKRDLSLDEVWEHESPWLWIPLLGFAIGFTLITIGACL